MLKIVVLGDSGVGKTSLLDRYINRKFKMNYKSTIGVDFLSKEIVINGNRYILQIWDTAGLEKYHSLSIPFYRGADGCVLIYDTDNVDSLKNLVNWKDEFCNSVENNDIPFLVIENKVDLRLAPFVAEQTKKRILELLGCLSIDANAETSAKTGFGVDNAFDKFATKVVLNKKECDLKHQSIKLDKKKENRNMRCC